MYTKHTVRASVMLVFFALTFFLQANVASAGGTIYKCLNQPTTLNWLSSNSTTCIPNSTNRSCDFKVNPNETSSKSILATQSCNVSLTCSGPGGTASDSAALVVDTTKIWNGSSCVANVPTTTTPTVSTSAATSVTSTTASSGGTISSNGGATVTVSGIVWSTSSNPTTVSYIGKTTDGWAIGGPWSDSITSLTSGITYHVRAYATNSSGTAYGADVQFTTTSATCSAGTASGCNLLTTSSGSSSGSCASGYTGTCSYSCNNGTWALSSNSCVAIPTPTVGLIATPSTIDNGQSTKLTWLSSNVSSCSFADIGVVGVSGTRTVSPSTTSTYQITCSTAFAQATVTVTQPLAVITLSLTKIHSGQTTTVSWTASQVKSCAVTKNGSAWMSGLVNSGVSQTLTGQTTYTLTCQTNGAPITSTAIVNIVPKFEEF